MGSMYDHKGGIGAHSGRILWSSNNLNAARFETKAIKDHHEAKET